MRSNSLGGPFARPLVLGLVLGLGPIAAVAAQESPLVGQECPKFAVSHPVQGPAWKQEDLLGSIVVLDLFQLG